MAFISRKSLTIKDLRRGGRPHRQVIYIQKDTKLTILQQNLNESEKSYPIFEKNLIKAIFI